MTFDPETLPPGALVAGTDWVKRCVLGSGGMGVVLGVEKDPGIRGAMKVMHAELANRPGQITRFLQEARMMVALRHPNIVQVIDAGRFPDGTPFVVTEWLEGRTLRASLEKHPQGLPAIVAWEINRQLCTGLHRAHCHTVKDVPTPIVHRDVKPENIFLQKQELAEPGVKLLDFGVAQLMDGTEDRRSTAGTLAYMAPEQVRGERVTPRTDVYAATLVLYEMLTGRLPWDVDTSDYDQMIAAHSSLAPIPPSRFVPWIPQRIEALILRGLAKKPADRPPSAYALAEELYELQFVDENAPTPSRVGVVKRAAEPSHATITAWEERERKAVGGRSAIVRDTRREMTPPPVEGRAPQVDPLATTAPATSAQPPASGKVPWHVAPTKSEGGTSRSLHSARQNASRSRRRNRALLGVVLLGVVGLVVAEAVVLVLRRGPTPQVATTVERGAAAEARLPEAQRAAAPAAVSASLSGSAAAKPVAPVAAPSSGSSEPPAPATQASAGPRTATASSGSATRASPPRPAPAVTRNTMADQL
jgi:serine/threonine-protein kinase